METQSKKYSINAKLIVVIGLIVIFTNLTIGFASYQLARNELNEAGKLQMKNGVKMAKEAIKLAHQDVVSGRVPLDQAQEKMKQYLLGPMDKDGKRPINKNIDLGESGYFFVLDDASNEIAHPTIEGQNTWNTKDMSGSDFYVSRDIIEKALGGGGYTFYSWKLPYSEAIASKVAYAEIDPYWDWIVVSSIYMSDFNEGADRIFDLMFWTTFVVFIITLPIVLKFSSHISKPINQISSAVRQVAEGNLTTPSLVIKNRDETGLLHKNFIIMVHSLREATEERLHAEKQLNKLNRGLESRVRERTTELNEKNIELETIIQDLKETQTQLIETEKMAALGGLVAGVAHELNTPLGVSISSISHLKRLNRTLDDAFQEGKMKRSVMESYLKDSLEDISMNERNLNRAVDLVKSFKDIAINPSLSELVELDICDYVKMLIVSMKDKYEDRPVNIDFLYDDEILMKTNPMAISQIFNNLLINALNHGYDIDEKGTITIEFEQVKNKVKMRFSDNGKGIAEDHIPRIFEPFFTLNRTQGGSGLGLHIVYNIVRLQLKGAIEVDSIVGGGTSFIITLPIDINGQDKV